ncbi:hypothetical protein L208DRAFT_1476868 [Tricholoma matsutake]|nr:hypothetical protein L208DRAFT_1476868 [Tricholoma matsutake 945]
MLNGTSKPLFGHVDYRKDHETSLDRVFQPGLGILPESIKHAKPALTVWAVRLVSSLVWAEGQQMIKASEKSKDGPNVCMHAKHATWDAMDSFSLANMQKIIEINAPVLWEIVSFYVNSDYGALVDNQAVAVHRHQPQNVMCTSAIMSMTFGHSDYSGTALLWTLLWALLPWLHCANLYALCCGIWYFAVKVHHSIFHVKSWLGQSVAYSSVYEALCGMAKQKLKYLKEALLPGSGHHTFVKPRDHRIRHIDGPHLKNVAVTQIMDVLMQFVPVLAIYSKQLKAWSEEILVKNPIPKNQLTKITPLATNNSGEMLVQEMKQGVLDFTTNQMGIDKEMLDNRCWIYSGDRKTFDQLLKLKKYLMAKEDFPDNTSTLGYAAKLVECLTPNDLKKVDFYDGAHIINLTLDAHVLNLWEVYFKTSDLVQYFEMRKEGNSIPTFNELLDAAGILSRRHATTQDEEDHLSDLSGAPDNPNADITLANSTLFIQNAIWWQEMCKAVANGDPG